MNSTFKPTLSAERRRAIREGAQRRMLAALAAIPDDADDAWNFEPSLGERVAAEVSHAGRVDDGLGAFPIERRRSVEQLRDSYRGLRSIDEVVVCLDRPEWGEMTVVQAGKRISRRWYIVRDGARHHRLVEGLRFAFKEHPWGVPSRAPNPNARPVRCVETGDVFESVSDAANACGVWRNAIEVALNRGWEGGGYHWRWCDVPEAEQTPFRESHLPAEAVHDQKTGTTYDSAAQAATCLLLAEGGSSSPSAARARRKTILSKIQVDLRHRQRRKDVRFLLVINGHQTPRTNDGLVRSARTVAA